MTPGKPVAWKTGDFAKGRSCPVRLGKEESPGRFTVELIANYEHGAGVCCGGYCSCYGINELMPITEPEDFIVCAAYEAIKKIEAAQGEIVRQEKIRDANLAALAAMKKAREAVAQYNQ